MARVSVAYAVLAGAGAVVVAVGAFLAGEPVDERVQLIGWLLIVIAVLNGLIRPRVR